MQGKNLDWVERPHHRVEWRSKCVKKASWSDAFFRGGGRKTTFLGLRISRRVRLVPSLTGHMGGIGGFSWS